MSSLDRLIRLAKRTGDRLIVHNPVDETDVVIMGIDEYENLLEEKQDVRGLSERGLLNQINRDIAIWRANDKLESESEEEVFDLEDNTASNWHSAGSVMESRGLDEFIPEEIMTEKEDNIEPKELNLEEVPDFEMLQKEVELEEIKVEENTSKGLISEDEPVFYEEPV